MLYVRPLVIVCVGLALCVALSVKNLVGLQPEILQQHLSLGKAPFSYPLNITVYPSKTANDGVTLCFHGHGGDYQTGAVIAQSINENVVSFDFPDAKILDHPGMAKPTSYGSINELLPAIYVVKKCLDNGHLSSINLYGFSAGGGAVVNVLAVLNRHDYDAELASIGIKENDKKQILEAVQRGYVILDCPLKSVEEVIGERGNSPQMQAFAKGYADNRLRPIDSLNDLNGLALTVVLNFQDPDEALTNRDDNLYIQRLRAANWRGKTIVVISHNEGHVAYHPDLWAAYKGLRP